VNGNQIAWRCQSCGNINTDTRKSFVICTNCGSTYDKAPVEDDPVIEAIAKCSADNNPIHPERMDKPRGANSSRGAGPV
jgi:predicted  nucleic acid-binding Zn-ribbon protein